MRIKTLSPSILYKLWDKDTIGGRRWNIVTQELKVCDVEIEIGTLVVTGSVTLTVYPIDKSKSRLEAEVLLMSYFFITTVLSHKWFVWFDVTCYEFDMGFSLFRHLWVITFQLFKLHCLAKDHWRGFSTRNAHMVHIVNYIRFKMVYTS